MAGGGGAWKVAYADFVTAMMAFFMVMWLTSQKPELKQSLANYFNDPWAKYKTNTNNVRNPTLKQTKAGAAPIQKPAIGSNPTSVPHDEAEWPEKSKPRLVTVRASERTTVGALLRFANGSEQLTTESQDRLKRLIPQLEGLPQKIEIRGHTSTQATVMSGQSDDAWRLSYGRSLSVMKFLTAQGIEPDRMRISQAGPYEPLTLDSQPDGEDKNSRVEVFLLSETVDSLKGTKSQRDANLQEVKKQLHSTPPKEPTPPKAKDAAHGSSHGGAHKSAH